MTGQIWVKVVGFTDTERHSLNTLFRLSLGNPVSYALWSDRVAHPPQIAIVDFDSYEAGLDATLPSFNANLKVIGVGEKAPQTTWQTFARPVNWSALVHTLGDMFSSHIDPNSHADTGLESTMPMQITMPPGLKVAMTVGLSSFDNFYLQARLALAGVADLEAADSPSAARSLLEQRNFDVVIICVDNLNEDPWALVKVLHDAAKSGQSVIVTGHDATVESVERAQGHGCLGMLEMPFSPRQVQYFLQRV
jgi:CheY-like chemotaxis protein